MRPAGPRARPACAAASTPSASPDTTGTPAPREPAAERARDLEPVGGRAARADDRDRRPATSSAAASPSDVQHRRRVGERAQPRGVGGASSGTPARRRPAPAQRARARRRRSARSAPARRRRRRRREQVLVGQREHARPRRRAARHSTSSRPASAAISAVRRRQASHAAASTARSCRDGQGGRLRGARPAASVMCSGPTRRASVEVGERAGDAQDAAVAARGQAVAVVELVEQRAARSASTSACSRSSRARHLRRCRSGRARRGGRPGARARRRRARGRRPSGGACSSRSAPAAGRPTRDAATSIRSSSGPDRRRWWRARSAARAACSRRRRCPHGHGFDAATSMKRVGNAITCWPRTIVTCPSSSGWRSASSARARELRQLVEEQHAVVGERRLARRRRASRRRPGRRPRSCGAARGTAAAVDEPAAVVQAGDRLDPRHLDRLDRRQRRQDRRQPAREHRLAGAGRAVQVEVVAAGGGDLERRDQPVVAADVGEVQRRRARRAAPAAQIRRHGRLRPRRAGTRRPPRASRRRAPRAPGRAPPRARDGARHEQPPQAVAARALGDRERAADRRAARRSSDSSPTTAQPSSASGSSWPPATSSATASGRSKPGPILRRSAGARLTVIRRRGNTKPEFTSAARTRSRASRTALSASPTTVNAGRP